MGALSEKSIRSKMMIIGVIVLAVFLVLCHLISSSTRQLIYRNEDANLKVAASRLHDEIELLYSKVETLCIHISEDTNVQALMNSDYGDIPSVMPGVKASLAKYMVLEPTILDFSLVNDRIHYSGVYHTSELNEIRKMVSGKPFLWIGIRPRSFMLSDSSGNMLVYAGDIISGTNNDGTVIISLDISQLMNEMKTQKGQIFYLADENGVIHTFSGSTDTATETHKVWNSSGFPAAMENPRYYIRSYDLTDMDCSLIAVLDLENTRGEMGSVELYSWIGVIFSALFCLLFYVLIIRWIVRPLRQFHHSIRSIRESPQREPDYNLNLGGCAEISEIGNEFSGMISDMEKLNQRILQNTTELYQMELDKQKAELAYLKSQIDPHFLYNTLEVVRKMAIRKGSTEIAQITLDMANIFRYSAKGEDIVPLEQEISIIKSYIRIQQMRFAGKIEVYYSIADNVLNIPIPKMILQPIVENSLFHGLEPKSETGSLFIGARTDQDDLVITIKDDGVGINHEQMEQIQQTLSNSITDTSEHVGIANTHARIRLTYGMPYGLSIDSSPGDGTTVILTLPVTQQ